MLTFKMARKRKMLTQKELSELVGVSTGTISKIETGKGISRIGDILDIGANLNIITKGGSWYSYNDTKIGQGRDNAKTYLLENPDVANEIEMKIRAKVAGDSSLIETEVSDDE